MNPSSSTKVGTPIPLYFPLSPQSIFLDKELIEAGTTFQEVLSTFPGSEVVFEYADSEPELEAQAEEVRRWNELMSVLSEDRAEKVASQQSSCERGRT